MMTSMFKTIGQILSETEFAWYFDNITSLTLGTSSMSVRMNSIPLGYSIQTDYTIITCYEMMNGNIISFKVDMNKANIPLINVLKNTDACSKMMDDANNKSGEVYIEKYLKGKIFLDNI